MKYKFNSIQQIINNTIILFIFIIFLLIVFLSWNGVKQYNNFVDYQKTISFNLVNSVAGEINHYLRERNRLVVLFVDEHLKLIKRTSDNPDSNNIDFTNLNNKVERYFPDASSFTITDEHGKSAWPNLKSNVSDYCLTDLKEFIKNDILLTRIHPDKGNIHFDIITRWSAGEKNGLFYLSFHIENLSRFINSVQIKNHNIFAINVQQNNLIEISKFGSFPAKAHSNSYLTESDLRNKLTQIEIPNTYWFMIDVVDDLLFSEVLYDVIVQSGIMFLLLLFSVLLIFYILKHGQTLLFNEQKYKNDFISIVSHELRTPLTSMIGSLDLVLGGVTGEIKPKTLELLTVAKKNGIRLKLLVDDLLDMQSIIYGRLSYKKEPVNVLSFITKSITDIQIYENKINFKLEHSEWLNETYLFIDEYRLSQVMSNLLKNAIRYGKSRDVEILVQKINESIRISVTDYGDGIPDKYHNIIFERFMTIDHHSNKNRLGVGLGLNLVKKIVEAHNGQVNFVTTLGKGTTFYFEIPEYIGFVSNVK